MHDYPYDYEDIFLLIVQHPLRGHRQLYAVIGAAVGVRSCEDSQ